jgi:diguanylate cyclase (GGDEF)-like protein
MDLFENEQMILDIATRRIEEVQNGAAFDFNEYVALVNEYNRLLKQQRRSTRLSDRTTGELLEQNQDLQEMTLLDPLTGLYNRRYLDETLTRNIKSLSRSGDCLSVLMVDVDFFKPYNDTYGHAAGDNCLKEVARGLMQCVTRGGDYVVRYGGEEFAIILPHTDSNGACKIARQLLVFIRELCIPHKKNEPIGYVTISIGLTTVSPEHTHKGRDYIKRADEALYLSKQNGRNRYTFLRFEY